MLVCAPLLIAQSLSNPSRWQAKYTPIYTEGKTVGPGTGLLLGPGASIVTDPSLVIGGSGASIRLDGGFIATNPAVAPLSPNTTYIVELQYRVVSNASNNDLLFLNMMPQGQTDQQHTVPLPSLYRNEPASGTFSSGAQTNSSGTYVMNIAAGPQVSIIIANVTIYRQDSVQTTASPAWANLGSLPFPRLAAWSALSPDYLPGGAMGGIPPYYFTVEQVENGLAFADVMVGFIGQTIGSDSVRRLRQLNPDLAILSSEIGTFEETTIVPPPNNGLVGLLYQYQTGIADAWYVKDSKGNYVVNADDGARELNVTQYAPPVNGKQYGDYLDDFLAGSMFPAGIWDGVFSDNLFGKLNPHIPSGGNPPTLDAIYNANGMETPASVSEWVRNGMISTLRNLRSKVGDAELIMGNTGPEPEPGLAPWVNGFTAECANSAWEPPGSTTPDEGAWRRVFDGYRVMQATVMRPATNVVTGCGGVYSNYMGTFVTPTAADIRRQRMILGTALLDDGFYAYGLCCQASPLTWFDEMTVDGNGNAVQDRQYKGYLGSALSTATELAPGGPVLYQQGFETPPLPSSLATAGDVYVSTDPSDVISGSGSLVLSNPDHTKAGSVTVTTSPGAIQLTPGNTYLIRFDWKILETLDDVHGSLKVTVCGDATCVSNFALGIVTGDSGTLNLPLTVTSAASSWTLTFGVYGGGGKVAVDNLMVVQGGAGPWRRDFENGLVLVNPLNAPHTFSVADLAGILKRTGIHRIKGTQAPAVNSGQPVTGSLTLAPFDAIVLLADPIRLGQPVITGVSNAAGGQPGVASGSFVSIYGANFTPLSYDDWSRVIINGHLPTALDGVSVSIGGKPAYIYAITSGQINVQAPDVGTGPVQVTVTAPGGTSASFATNAQLYSPAFFLWPNNQAVATHADYSLAAQTGTFQSTATVPAKPGEVITLWGTGFGPTNPPVAAGQEPAVQAPPTQAAVSATLGGTSVPVLGAVLSSYAATYQVAIQIPSSTADGNYPIVASVNGVQSPGNVVLAVHQ